MNPKNLQTVLLERVLQHFSSKSAAADTLADLLNITRESIYRRLRGETLLTPDEIQLLATRFRISIDAIIQPATSYIPFIYNMFSRPITDLFGYVGQVYENMQLLKPLKDVQIYYASQEIPIFEYFFFPELLSFKLYVYGLTSWDLHYLEDQKFSTGLVPVSVTDQARECVRLYSSYHSRSLWSLTFIENTLNQIEYIASVRRIDPPGLALVLCDQLEQLLERAGKMAELGKKFFQVPEVSAENGTFELYFNELASTNNTILVVSPGRQLLYTTFGTPNFLVTTDATLCKYTQNWFDTIISRSTAISVHNAKERDHFFHLMNRKVDRLRRKLTADLHL